MVGKTISVKEPEHRMQKREKQHLAIDMHGADFECARASADQLGIGLEAYILLATHLVSTAVLSGTPTMQVPSGGPASDDWRKEKREKCAQIALAQAA